MEILEMKQRRAALVKGARKLLDTAETEKRELTGEETQKYEEMMKDVDSWGSKIEREESLRKMEETLKEPEEKEVPTQTEKPEERKEVKEAEEYRKSFEKFLRGGYNSLTEKEIRTMQADDPVESGYLVAPQQFVKELLKNVDDMVVIRRLARTIPLKQAASLGVPKLDSDFDDCEWVAELQSGTADNLEVGKRELRPHGLLKVAKVSNKLVRISAMSIDQIVRERLSNKFAATMEKAYMEGDGIQKPLGLFVASADGINTDRDVSGVNTATAIKADTLITAKYTLKSQYHSSARWIFHRSVLEAIRKLKDGDGQYLWQPGLRSDGVDNILGFPVIMSEFAPSTMTSALYVGMLGDFSKYWIADAMDMQVQVARELYAETREIGYFGYLESDAAPALSEAFVRIQMGS